MNAAMTYYKRRQYLKNPDHCPCCGSRELTEVLVARDKMAWRERLCRTCGAEWQDIFEMVTIDLKTNKT